MKLFSTKRSTIYGFFAIEVSLFLSWKLYCLWLDAILQNNFTSCKTFWSKGDSLYYAIEFSFPPTRATCIKTHALKGTKHDNNFTPSYKKENKCIFKLSFSLSVYLKLNILKWPYVLFLPQHAVQISDIL